MRHVYLAATGQNRGKTTVSLGVLDGFQRRGLSTGFLKPVGQRTIIEDGVPADEDAVLMKHVFGLREPLGQMSPVHIPRGFTQAYIEGEVVEVLHDLAVDVRLGEAARDVDRAHLRERLAQAEHLRISTASSSAGTPSSMIVRWPTGFMNAVERPRRRKPSSTPRLTVVLPRFWPVAAR